MGDFAEEQADELEALGSIFPENLTVISPSEFKLSGSADGGTFGDKDYTAGFSLAVKFPTDYPEVAPEVDLVDLTGELEENEDMKSELLDVVSETVEENLGMAMVFAIHAAVQERLEDLLTKQRDTAHSTAEAEKSAAIEAEIARYTAGTLVTPESFAEWKEKFEAEMAPFRQELRKLSQTTVEGKLTGRQLFEQKKMKNDSEAAFMDKTDIIVDTSVFEGLDLDDIELPDEGGADAPS
eukprot:m.194855 g.194855  ORF g.194855 m.194855 type:complete len:239 (-) comp19310_c0_seq1:345-1061(-)